jgi:hypothetical protein
VRGVSNLSKGSSSIHNYQHDLDSIFDTKLQYHRQREINMGIIDKYQNPNKAKMAVFKSEMPKNRRMILSDAEYK